MIQPIKQVKWQSLVSEWQASGQSVAAFCRRREVPASQFHYWKKRLREDATPPFVELEVAKPQLRAEHFPSMLGSAIEVRLSNGRSLMVRPDFDANHLRALLAIVESWS